MDKIRVIIHFTIDNRQFLFIQPFYLNIWNNRKRLITLTFFYHNVTVLKNTPFLV
jgi:hypothetical protein